MEYKIIKNDIEYNLDDLTKLLNTSYWAKDRKKETVKKTVENSLCFLVISSVFSSFSKVKSSILEN